MKVIQTPTERRARLEMRRAKQRETNIARAQAMHKERLAGRNNLSGPVSSEHLHLSRLNVGCSGGSTGTGVGVLS
jgi:hypothetical protein